MDNGILKCHRYHPFAKSFQLNCNLDEKTIDKISICANAALGYKPKSEKEAQIIKNIIGLIDQANKNPQAAGPCLEVAQCSIEALNGNKEFEFLLSKPELLKKPQDIMEAYKKIQQKNKAKLIPTNLPNSTSSSPSPEDPEKFKDKDKKYKHGKYKDAPYHGKVGNATKSKAPKNGQEALDNSIDFKEKGNTEYQRRLGISNDEFVVLDQTSPGEFHGHVETWAELREPMRTALRRSGLVTNKGKIIKNPISKL